MTYMVGINAMVASKEILLRYAGSDRIESRTLYAPDRHRPGILCVQVGVVLQPGDHVLGRRLLLHFVGAHDLVDLLYNQKLQIGGLRPRDPAEGEAIVLLHKASVGEVGGGTGLPALVQSERHGRPEFI